MNRQLITFVSVVCTILLVAAGVIAYGRGRSFDFGKNQVITHGILTVSSFPQRSSIWIDNTLTGVTDTSLSLPPGWHDVRIRYEGYQEWQKKVRVQGEIVSQIDALLIPVSPSLRTLTASGVFSPILSPSGASVTYITRDGNEFPVLPAENKTGIWIQELRNGPLGRKTEPLKIFTPKTPYRWESPILSWTPDETAIVADATQSALLLPVDGTSASTELSPPFLTSLQRQWEEEKQEKDHLALATLTDPLASFLAGSSAHVRFSPDETKILYEATASATLPPPKKTIIGSNSTAEVRDLTPGVLYVYDQKEERNYQVAKVSDLAGLDTTRWYTDSKHIVMIEKDTIYIIDYDGTNKRAVYAGPFDPTVLYPWPAGGRLVILTNFNKPETPPNLYLLDLT